MTQHLERLRVTCRGLQFAKVPALSDLAADCLDLVRLSGLTDAVLYLHISRGQESFGRKLSDYRSPNVIIRAAHPPAWPKSSYQDGVKVITLGDQRWSRAELKTVNLLPRVLAFEVAKSANAVEALWVDPDSTVHEGLSCNVFAWVNNLLVTPPLSGRVLAGITRSAIFEICRGAGIEFSELPLSLTDLYEAEEAFICSTTRQLMPVVSVDDRTIGSGRPGPKTQDLRRRYRDLVRSG